MGRAEGVGRGSWERGRGGSWERGGARTATSPLLSLRVGQGLLPLCVGGHDQEGPYHPPPTVRLPDCKLNGS